MHRSKLIIWLAGALIVVSVIAGWIAIGRLAAATGRGMERTEESLKSARDLAADTAASAAELQRVIPLVGAVLDIRVPQGRGHLRSQSPRNRSQEKPAPDKP
jgi:hypothetical protein